MATLELIEGPCAGRRFAVDARDSITLGRAAACTFRLDDEHVSREHLEIRYRYRADCHYAVDRGSANGTILNGARVRPGIERELVDGDLVAIGRTMMRYTSRDDPRAEVASSTGGEAGALRSTFHGAPGAARRPPDP